MSCNEGSHKGQDNFSIKIIIIINKRKRKKPLKVVYNGNDANLTSAPAIVCFLVLDLTNRDFFLNHQDTRLLPRKIYEPYLDFLSSGSLAQFAS